MGLLRSSFTTISGTDGSFIFDPVYLGDFEVLARDGNLNDRTTGTVTFHGEIIERTLTLLPLPTLTGIVYERDGSTPVPNAQVSVAERVASTDSSGRYRIEGLIPNSYSVIAIKPGNGDRGRAFTNVRVIDGDNVQDIVLRGFGALDVTVVDPTNVLVPNASVSLGDVEGFSQQLEGTANSSGVFSAPEILAVRYRVLASDPVSGLSGAAIVEIDPAQTTSVTVTLNGIGHISGTVYRPDGTTPASDVVVSLSPDGDVQTTDAAGYFRFMDLSVGTTYTLQARSADNLLTASSNSIIINQHQEEVVYDLTLRVEAISLFDANAFEYRISGDGIIPNGNTNIFLGDGQSQRGAMSLRVTDAVGTQAFSGDNLTVEQDNQALTIPDQMASGLDVTRKIFVAEDGYFARYVDSFTNASTVPMTIDIHIDTYYRFISQIRDGFTFNDPPRVISSSDGDTTLTLADRWAVIDDNNDLDPFLTTNLPTVSHVFDGTARAVCNNRYRFGR